MSSHRNLRVAQAIREVVASAILFETADPRIRSVTVLRRRGLRGPPPGDGLRHGRWEPRRSKLSPSRDSSMPPGFFQSEVADRLQTRFTPMLTFKLDDSVKKSVEISRLIAEAVASDLKPDHAGGDPARQADPDLSPTRRTTTHPLFPPENAEDRCLCQNSRAGEDVITSYLPHRWHFVTMSLMATQSKSQFLTDVHAQLKRRYKPKPDRNAGRLSVLEAVVYGICHEDTTREQANQALSRFKDQFFDWNEVRVSPIAEIQETLADIPDPDGRGRADPPFPPPALLETYGFTLEPLTKKPLKEALKVLHAYEAFASDYVTATVIQQALGGHAIPIDSSTPPGPRTARASPIPTCPALRSVLERAVPKNRGVEFLELLEELAHDTCVNAEPDCPRCELRKISPLRADQKTGSPASPDRQARGSQGTSTGTSQTRPTPEKTAKKPATEAAKPKPAPTVKKPGPSNRPLLLPSLPLASAAVASRRSYTLRGLWCDIPAGSASLLASRPADGLSSSFALPNGTIMSARGIKNSEQTS